MASFSLFFKNRLACFHDYWIHAWHCLFRPLGAFLLRGALILSFILPNFLVFCPAASAADANGFLHLDFWYKKNTPNAGWVANNGNYDIEIPLISSKGDYGLVADEENAKQFFIYNFRTNTGPLYGAVGVYLSYFYTGYETSQYDYKWQMIGTPNYYLRTFDSTGNKIDDYAPTAFTTFNPVSAPGANFYSPGYRFSFRVDNAGTEERYAQNPSVWAVTDKAYFQFDNSTGKFGHAGVAIPSFQVITTETSADLEALENIANSLVEQNNILNAMYGDILAVCNSIYARTGDLLETQKQANNYLKSVKSLLSQIKTKTTDIYNLLGTQFQLLIDTINSGVVSVTDAIAAAELRLEQYLKPVIDYFNSLEETTGESASKLPGHKADLDNAVSSSSGIDTNGQQGFSAIWSMISQFELLLVCIGMWLGATIFLIVIKKGLS